MAPEPEPELELESELELELELELESVSGFSEMHVKALIAKWLKCYCLSPLKRY